MSPLFLRLGIDAIGMVIARVSPDSGIRSYDATRVGASAALSDKSGRQHSTAVCST